MSETAKIVSKPIPESSTGVKKPVAEPIAPSFIPDAGLMDVANQANEGISEQLNLHQQKTKPPKKSEPVTDMTDIRNHPKKWYDTDLFGKVKNDKNGNPKKKNGRPKKPRAGDKLVGGGTWPPPTASTISEEPASQGSTINGGGESGGAAPGETNRMDLGEEAGEILTDHLERMGETIGGENGKPTTAEKKVMSKALAASLGEWQIYPPLAVLVFGALYLVRVKISAAFSKKTKDNKSDGSKTSSVPGDNGQRQNGDGKTTQWEYPKI